MVQAYWQVGERIVREEMKNRERAEYGKYLVNKLSIDLGIERRMMYRIVRFYEIYPIVVSLIPQLNWTHYYWLVDIKDNKERKFYEQKIIVNSWSVRELRKNIEDRLYQKTDAKEIEEMLKTKLPTIINVRNIFKPDYDFNFLEISPNHLEKELEREEVVYALNGLEEQIFVSIYKTKLPSEEKIKRMMRGL
ncbi:MAG: DUF1016 N-terminal domain-containing protein [Patescibacteria group bacterium]